MIVFQAQDRLPLSGLIPILMRRTFIMKSLIGILNKEADFNFCEPVGLSICPPEQDSFRPSILGHFAQQAPFYQIKI